MLPPSINTFHTPLLQMVRGAVSLPHGTGSRVSICVFATGAEAEAAREEGEFLLDFDQSGHMML